MLIQFRIENHRSLCDEQILSLTTSMDKAGAHVLRVPGLNETIVPVAAIYGANASGKSNVVSALGFMRSAILESQRFWEIDTVPRTPFLLSTKSAEPSLYEVDISVSGVRYRYGFQLDATRIKEEWLFAWPNGKKAMWFERDNDDFAFGKTLHGENDAIRSLTRSNSLFLSAAAQNNHASLMPVFRHFAAWRVSLMRPSGVPRLALSALARTLGAEAAEPDRDGIMRLLREADTGILDVKVESHDAEPPDLELGDTQLAAGTPRHGPPAIFFRHRSADEARAWLPLAAESAGTIALLELAPRILHTLRTGGLLCVDELEASLHPALALNIVKMFNDPAHNTNNAQLVFTTHDANLLGSVSEEPALRRDQVWFTEKDDAGRTHLYPLTDFHPRKEENLERGYLQGRYGAVPFLGDLVAKANEES